MTNFQAIKDFVDYWRARPEFKVAPTGNCTFPAHVKYTFGGRTIEENATATIIRNGYTEGKISLSEDGALSVDLLHLDFSPDFQKYIYIKSDHSFVVEGNSPKMNGPYRVIISPE